MPNEELKTLVKTHSDKDFAIAMMDIAHKEFTEDNFYYYDYSVNIFLKLITAYKDGILPRKRFESIQKIVAKLINQSIGELKEVED